LKDTCGTDSSQVVLQIKNFYLNLKLVLPAVCYYAPCHQQISLGYKFVAHSSV